jgi:hypothetical protein
VKKTNENGISLTVNSEETGLDRAEIRKLNALVRKTNIEHPKPEDMQALRDLLSGTANLWRVMGDLANQSTLSMGWKTQFAIVEKWQRESIAGRIRTAARYLSHLATNHMKKLRVCAKMIVATRTTCPAILRPRGCSKLNTVLVTLKTVST